MDAKWWDAYIKEARESVTSEFVSTSSQVTKHGIKKMIERGFVFENFGNSGAGAVSLAVYMGAKRVILVGYDCQKSNDKVHFFGNHPAGLGNAGSMPKWPAQFDKLAKHCQGVQVINCSRETALTCFPREDLNAVLD